MNILSNKTVSNSLRIKSKSRYYIEINKISDFNNLYKFINDHSKPVIVLGEGTNIIPKDYFDGMAVKPKFNHIDFDKNKHIVSVGSSINWHFFVKEMVNKNIYGYENLSLIPGSVGASPIQNIGAYGVEVSSFIDYVETMNLNTGNLEVFNLQECKFGYRESIFKKLPNHFITKIKFSLSEAFKPNLAYESIPKDIDINSGEEVRSVILKIRNDRLINPEEEPNVGSFFKNPVVSKTHLDKLLSDYSDLKFYGIKENQYKISAAWLIEKIGMKGHEDKECGVSKKHSLVLVNSSEKSENIINLSNKIRDEIFKRFDIKLENEPTLIT